MLKENSRNLGITIFVEYRELLFLIWCAIDISEFILYVFVLNSCIMGLIYVKSYSIFIQIGEPNMLHSDSYIREEFIM